MARHREVQCEEAGDGRQEHRMHETWPEKYVQDLRCKGGSRNTQESCDNEVDEQGHESIRGHYCLRVRTRQSVECGLTL